MPCCKQQGCMKCIFCIELPKAALVVKRVTDVDVMLLGACQVGCLGLCILICPGPLCPRLWQRCKYQCVGLESREGASGRVFPQVLSFWSPEFVANSGISMDFCKLRIMCIPCRETDLPGATLQFQHENWGMRISQHPFQHKNTLLKAKGINTPWRKNDVQFAPHQFRIWHVESNYSKSFGWGPDV